VFLDFVNIPPFVFNFCFVLVSVKLIHITCFIFDFSLIRQGLNKIPKNKKQNMESHKARTK